LRRPRRDVVESARPQGPISGRPLVLGLVQPVRVAKNRGEIDENRSHLGWKGSNLNVIPLISQWLRGARHFISGKKCGTFFRIAPPPRPWGCAAQESDPRPPCFETTLR